MYDSNMYSSPLSLLQLPASALPEVTGRLTQPGNSVARFSQDGKTLADLRTLVPEPDFRQAAEVTVDVGFVCKKCHTVYPAEVLCLNHQRTTCFQNKSVGDIKATLKLVQCHVECRACKERFTTVMDFKFHCDMDRHIKRVQKIQREASANASANNSNNSAAIMANNAFEHAVSNFNRLMPMNNSNNNNNNNSAAAAANHFDTMVSRMAAVSNSNNNGNNAFASDGNAMAAAGLLGCRNGMLPDMAAQLFFSGMNIDALRMQLENAESKSKTNSAVGCGVDAIS